VVTKFLGLRRLIKQIRREPPFDSGDFHLLSSGIVFHLILIDLANRKVFGLGVSEVEAADRGGGEHGKCFGELNTDSSRSFHPWNPEVFADFPG